MHIDSKLVEAQSIGKILDRSLKLLPKVIKQLLPLMIAVSLLQTAQNSQIFLPKLSFSTGAMGAIYIIAIVLLVPFYTMLYFKQIFIASDAWLGKDIENKEAQRKFSLGLLFRLIGLTIKISLITGLGLLLLIIPGLVYAVNRILSYYILIIENCSIKEATTKSKFLMTQGRWYKFDSPPMRITGLWFILALIGLTAGSLLMFGTFMSASSSPLLLALGATLLTFGIFISNIVGAYKNLCLIGFYHDLCVRYEGKDLIQQIETLTNNGSSKEGSA